MSRPDIRLVWTNIFLAIINIFLQVPPEYVSVAGEQYYISERPLSWSQAQYNCMSREGEDTHNIYKMHEDT